MAGGPEQHTTITVPEIAKRLGVCEETIYEMLKLKEIPNLRHGHRFIISRAAYEHWEATIGQMVQDIHDTANSPNTVCTRETGSVSPRRMRE